MQIRPLAFRLWHSSDTPMGMGAPTDVHEFPKGTEWKSRRTPPPGSHGLASSSALHFLHKYLHPFGDCPLWSSNLPAGWVASLSAGLELRTPGRGALPRGLGPTSSQGNADNPGISFPSTWGMTRSSSCCRGTSWSSHVFQVTKFAPASREKHLAVTHHKRTPLRAIPHFLSGAWQEALATA